MKIRKLIARATQWIRSYLSFDQWSGPSIPKNPAPLTADDILPDHHYLHVVVIGGARLHVNEYCALGQMRRSENPLTPELFGFDFMEVTSGKRGFHYAGSMGLIPNERENLERVFRATDAVRTMIEAMRAQCNVRGYIALIRATITPQEYMLLSPDRERALFVNDERDPRTFRKEYGSQPEIVNPIEESELVAGHTYLVAVLRDDGHLFSDEFVLVGRSSRVPDEYDILLRGHKGDYVTARMNSWALGFDREKPFGLARVFKSTNESRHIIGNIIRLNDKEGYLEIVERTLSPTERKRYDPSSARARWDDYLDDRDRGR